MTQDEQDQRFNIDARAADQALAQYRFGGEYRVMHGHGHWTALDGERGVMRPVVATRMDNAGSAQTVRLWFYVRMDDAGKVREAYACDDEGILVGTWPHGPTLTRTLVQVEILAGDGFVGERTTSRLRALCNQEYRHGIVALLTVSDEQRVCRRSMARLLVDRREHAAWCDGEVPLAQTPRIDDTMVQDRLRTSEAWEGGIAMGLGSMGQALRDAGVPVSTIKAAWERVIADVVRERPQVVAPVATQPDR